MARILLVDDEATIRMMIRLALEFVHHDVRTAADGEDGLRQFEDGTAWDLVLLDQRLPGLSGLEVLQRMRQVSPAARVMLITAFGTIDLAYEAMRSGAVDFLRKPFTADILRGAVQQALAAVPPHGEPPHGFSITTLNGFRVHRSGDPSPGADGVQHSFDITGPTGDRRTCQVVLPRFLMTLVSEHTRPSPRLSQEAWWQLLCEEVLANYLWQHSEFPPDELRVDELTTGLRRWMEAILAETR